MSVLIWGMGASPRSKSGSRCFPHAFPGATWIQDRIAAAARWVVVANMPSGRLLRMCGLWQIRRPSDGNTRPCPRMERPRMTELLHCAVRASARLQSQGERRHGC